jgi:DNA-binding LacI/PurR family transcriptional regulator
MMNKRRRATPAKMADIARLAGVSASTVSRALAGSALVAALKRDEILRLARERGYVVNSTARNLRLQRTQTLGVVIPLGHATAQPLSDPFFTELIGHLADAITERGYAMFLRKLLPPIDDGLAELVANHRADGLIFLGQSTGHAALEALASGYKPMVVWGAQLPEQSYCTVGTDHLAGALAAVEHLLAGGRQRIVFVGDPAVPEIGLRYAGYRLALERAGKFVAMPHVLPAHLSADLAAQAIGSLLVSGEPCDALFCASDMLAASALHALTAAGRAVPREVALVGFDDTTLAAQTNPPLSTVRQPIQRGVHMLVDLLFRRLAGEDTPSVMLPGELVIRQSSG